jgi:hypothetical protein
MKGFKSIYLSKKDREILFPKHSGNCDICKEQKAVALDFNPKTKSARGLLCIKCKELIVWGDEDIDKLKRAAAFCELLKKEKELGL